jgi:uncharacterized DUF497 family protein
MRTKYTWNPLKAELNKKNHEGVTFEEASTVFDDPMVEILPDLEHGEVRAVALGMSSHARVLYVVHIEIKDGHIHIISARKATKHERKRYEEGQ